MMGQLLRQPAGKGRSHFCTVEKEATGEKKSVKSENGIFDLTFHISLFTDQKISERTSE